jgi:tryptophan synthase alpha chain
MIQAMTRKSASKSPRPRPVVVNNITPGRVEAALRRRLDRGSKNLVPFFTAGFPDSQTFLALVRDAEDIGCDALEVGLPFSDPIADGPAIQFSNHRVLSRGMNIPQALELVAQAQAKIPVLLMSYLNPILAYGFHRFVEDARAAGISGMIIPDIPLEVISEPNDQMNFAVLRKQLETVLMVAPTTTPRRMSAIGSQTRGFLYAVTVTGTTGARKTLPCDTDVFLRNVCGATTRPVLAGFGISDARNARAIARHCDGVIVGSALINQVRSGPKKSIVKRVRGLLQQLRRAL